MTVGAHITIARGWPNTAAAMREPPTFAYDARELGAPIAAAPSGRRIAVVPCSMRSLAAIATATAMTC